MRKIRGFKLGKRVVKFCGWFFRRSRNPSGYHRLGQSTGKTKTISRLCNWGQRLKTKAKRICSLNPGPACFSGYLPVGEEMPAATVPKGHLVVYVGQKDGDFQRVLVPVIYFNHPLFGELLRESEEEYGFQHPGGITIPCRISEFESVQTRIAACQGCRKMTWRRHYSAGCHY